MDGYDYITNRIAAAKSAGETFVTISGDYEISKTVVIPSDTTLILDDCHLTMADGTFVRMFENENLNNTDKIDKNIKIIGIGRAILDGGNYNGLSESNSEKNGRPHICSNNLIMFAGVDNFTVSNLKAQNQRWWAFNFISCSNGVLSNLEFASDCTYIDQTTGERVYGLNNCSYNSIYIKNSDGIDLRCGCHDILIDNVSGFTEDDTVALTALKYPMEKKYIRKGDPWEIYNVIVRNVHSSAYCSNVRLLNQGETKLHDIVVDGVYDTSETDDRMDRGICAVRLGDEHMYGERHSNSSETYNIIIRNVFSRAQKAIKLVGATKNVIYENISGEKPLNEIIYDVRPE